MSKKYNSDKNVLVGVRYLVNLKLCPKSDISGISLLPQLKPLRFYLGGPRINKLPCGRCWSEQQVIKRRLGAKRELCTNKFRKYSKVHTNAGRCTKFTKNTPKCKQKYTVLWNFKVYEELKTHLAMTLVLCSLNIAI